jgi:hypothetical protein
MCDSQSAGAPRPDGADPRNLHDEAVRPLLAALRLFLLIVVCSLSTRASLDAQPVRGISPPGVEVETLTLKAYRMLHQPAREALPLVEPLLSPRGTVELRLDNNTLVIRDHPTVIGQIEPLLREFDHLPRELPIVIHLLEAQRAGSDASPDENTRGLPPGLIASLGVMAQFNRYHLVAAIDLESKEGENVSYELGREYEVRFAVGTVLLDRRVKLHGFEILRPLGAGLDRQLFLGNLNLTLGRTLVVAVADAGMAVAVTCAPDAAASKLDADGGAGGFGLGAP